MRKVWIVLLLALFAAAGWQLATRRERAEWTTRSPEALREYQAALDAETKFYRVDAYGHLQRALTLDPGFVAAKLEILSFPDLLGEKETARMAEEVRSADRSRLNERERFLVDFRMAARDGEREKAGKLLEDYLKRHPDDVWALRYRVARVWAEGRWEEAERDYKRLLELDPNWVLAHNHLGYIYMAQGKFAQAEEAFRTYRYIAPDQANPHDSLGELLILLGRYDEARAELREAVRVRPDFCASWMRLLELADLEGDAAAAQQVIADTSAKQGCGAMQLGVMRCNAAVWSGAMRHDWEATYQAAQSPDCGGEGDVRVLGHRAAVATGRLAEAQEMERQVRDKLEHYREGGKSMDDSAAMLAHLEGARLELTGDLAGAVERYRAADQAFRFWNPEGGAIFKLYNQACLARVLQESGRDEEARTVLEAVRRVNPHFLDNRLVNPPARAAGAAAAAPAAAPSR